MSTELAHVEAEPPVRRDRWYWWLMSGDDYTAPETNNGEEYLPGWKVQWMRDAWWWLRNPAGNLMGRVLGVQGRERWVWGPAPVLKVTPADEDPPRRGWKWCITYLKPDGWFGLPFVGYYGICEFYLGWKPNDGALGVKIVNASRGEN